MLPIGVQTKNIVEDNCPGEGFRLMRQAGFSCGDFSLNGYLLNSSLYQSEVNTFFDQSLQELEHFFAPHKKGADEAGITINQMHMPYPNYVPRAAKALNDYLRDVVAPKSMQICAFFNCPCIVIHGFKLAYFLGSEEEEWRRTEMFLDNLAPMAKDMGITMCIENLYDSLNGHLVEGPCCNARKAADRIDRMNDRYHAQVLGFCFDTGHANLTGLDFEDFITTLDYRLKVLHIHDNDGVSDLHQVPFTFTKTRENLPSTDWNGFIKGLKNIKFSKTLSFETAPVLTSFPEELKPQALSFIAGIGKYFSDSCL
ncbi:MAG: sugar phosphate isomerase/epimerase [Hungatella sp.]|nr:sugar phosphate isomerase/epimerase [Hungatella sp.]